MPKHFLNEFRYIFAASTVVANLKRISCSLTELRLLFMSFFESGFFELRNGELYPTVRIFKCFRILSPRHVPEGQRLQHLVDRIASEGCFVSQLVLLTNISVELLLNRGSKKKGLFESRPICR